MKKENICSVDEQAFHSLAGHCCGNCIFYAVVFDQEDLFKTQEHIDVVCDRNEEETLVDPTDICKYYEKAEVNGRIIVRKKSQVGISSRGWGTL